MASFTFKTFSDLLQDAIDTMTAGSTQLINFGEGSVVRVLFEAVCGRLDYFTIQLRKILLLCRLATSTGDDVDSFIADYGMDARLPSVQATGSVTFSRRVAANSIVAIAAGTQVSAFDNSVTFTVIADPTNGNYDPAGNRYLIQANTLTVTAKVQALTAGVIGNVAAGSLSIIGSTLPGVDVVTNSSAIINGRDAETDAQVKARFVKFVATRARATKTALSYAVDIVQNGLTYIIKENIDISGSVQLGHVVIVVDDGSGSPPSSLLTAIRASVDLYRAFSVSVDVYAPTVLTTAASCTVVVDSAYDSATVKTAVQSALTSWLNSQPIGQFLSREQGFAMAFSVPGVVDCNNVLLNASSSDITPAFNQVIKAGTVTVS